jgi:hypothetical protein
MSWLHGLRFLYLALLLLVAVGLILRAFSADA